MVTDEIELFCTQLKDTKSVIAIDYGKSKLGLAISDPTLRVSMPLTIILKSQVREQLKEVANIVHKHQPCGIIVGLPVNMDGSFGVAAQVVKSFALKVYEIIKLPIFLQDERLTSKAADNLLKGLHFSRKKRAKMEDKVAANLILETFIIRRSNTLL